jgi:hypothetical protein
MGLILLMRLLKEVLFRGSAGEVSKHTLSAFSNAPELS